jgi:hypothetical protein
MPVVIVTIHAGCSACAEYVAKFVSRIQEIRDWDGRVLVVVGGHGSLSLKDACPGDQAIRAASDPDQRLSGAGVPTPAVLVADQTGRGVRVGKRRARARVFVRRRNH